MNEVVKCILLMFFIVSNFMLIDKTVICLFLMYTIYICFDVCMYGLCTKYHRNH
jgi:hypothetical protein